MCKLNRGSAMSGDFDTLLGKTRGCSQPLAPGKLDMTDFPAMLAHRYGNHNVEMQQFPFLSMERFLLGVKWAAAEGKIPDGRHASRIGYGQWRR